MSDPRFPSPRPFSAAAAAEARAAFDVRTTPVGSLGKLRELATWWSGSVGQLPVAAPSRAKLLVFAADHGVTVRGVSPEGAPSSGERVRRLLAGESALARLVRHADGVSFSLDVVDVGLFEAGAGRDRRIGAGTRDLSVERAMSTEQALGAIRVGIECATEAARDGFEAIAVGEIGAGGSTAAAAVLGAIAAVPGKLAAGRGSGIDDAGVARKVRAIDAGIALHAPGREDGVAVLSAVGGFELGAVAGVCIGAAALGLPVVLDGFVGTAGALIASVIEPGCIAHVLIGHRSTENGHWAMARYLRREPALDLDMGVTEGVGALLAVQAVRTAVGVVVESA